MRIPICPLHSSYQINPNSRHNLGQIPENSRDEGTGGQHDMSNPVRPIQTTGEENTEDNSTLLPPLNQ